MSASREQRIQDASYTYTSDVLPSQFNNVLQDFGDQKIVAASIERKPIAPLNKKILNALSRGKLQKQQDKLQYDSFFHSWINLELEDGTKVSTDKVQYLTMKANPHVHPLGQGTDSRKVDITKDVTLRQMVVGGIDKAGSVQKLATYKPVESNCQKYIIDMIGGSGLMTDENKKWVKQDVGDALSGPVQRGIEKLTKFAGDLYGPDKDLVKLQRAQDARLGFTEKPVAGHRPSGTEATKTRLQRAKNIGKGLEEFSRDPTVQEIRQKTGTSTPQLIGKAGLGLLDTYLQSKGGVKLT